MLHFVQNDNKGKKLSAGTRAVFLSKNGQTGIFALL